MKDQIIMSKSNGNCAVAIPLFRLVEDDKLDKIENYVIAFNSSKPVAYVIDIGDPKPVILSASCVETEVDFIGDL